MVSLAFDKSMILRKRECLDTEVGANLLIVQSSKSTEQDSKKALRMLSFIVAHKSDVSCFNVYDSKVLTWSVDVVFTARAGMRN